MRITFHAVILLLGNSLKQVQTERCTRRHRPIQKRNREMRDGNGEWAVGLWHRKRNTVCSYFHNIQKCWWAAKWKGSFMYNIQYNLNHINTHTRIIHRREPELWSYLHEFRATTSEVTSIIWIYIKNAILRIIVLVYNFQNWTSVPTSWLLVGECENWWGCVYSVMLKASIVIKAFNVLRFRTGLGCPQFWVASSVACTAVPSAWWPSRGGCVSL